MKTSNSQAHILKVLIILILSYTALLGTIFCGWLLLEWYIDFRDEILTPGEIIAIPIGLLALLLVTAGFPIAAISQILKRKRDEQHQTKHNNYS